jgi:hypothetical protein
MKPILGILLLAAVHTLVQAQTTQTIALRQGWNLISFPGAAGEPHAGPRAQRPVRRSLDQCPLALDLRSHLRSLAPLVPGSELSAASGQGIHVIEPFRGYWIDVALPNLTLTVVGGEATMAGSASRRDGICWVSLQASRPVRAWRRSMRCSAIMFKAPIRRWTSFMPSRRMAACAVGISPSTGAKGFQRRRRGQRRR